MADRSEPGPLSSLDVTTKESAQAEPYMASNTSRDATTEKNLEAGGLIKHNLTFCRCNFDLSNAWRKERFTAPILLFFPDPATPVDHPAFIIPADLSESPCCPIRTSDVGRPLSSTFNQACPYGAMPTVSWKNFGNWPLGNEVG